MALRQLHEDLVAKKITARQLTEEAIAKIQARDESVHAFVNIDFSYALSEADKVDAKIQGGEEIGLLEGIPVAVKDNICTLEFPTTCSSKMLENFRPPYEATVVKKLKEAGAIIIGKTNMDEFAMGSTTETSYFGVTKNPLNEAHVPGGSSGGSAAAVAAGYVPYSLGSDTGGSIRQPAAYCGIYGLKPTYGAVSRTGLIAFASSLDQIGPFATTPEDLALVMNVIAGHDERDNTSVPNDLAQKKFHVAVKEVSDAAEDTYPDFAAYLGKSIQGLRVGIAKEFNNETIDESVRAQLQRCADLLRSLGAEIKEVSLPNVRYSIPMYYVLATAEASSNLARYDGVRYGLRVPAGDTKTMFEETRHDGFGDEVQRRIMVGTYVLSAGYYDAYYTKALRARRLLRDEFMAVLDDVDVILTPTTVSTALKLGEKKAPVELYQEDVCTASVNLVGLPALSLPFGTGTNDLPVGLQLIGKAFSEPVLLQIAQAVHEAKEKGGLA